MNTSLQLQIFNWPPHEVKIYVPEQEALKQSWQKQSSSTRFPYWAKIWPAAVALCNFIHQYPVFIHNKNVIEIAAGLALPSLYAAHIARQVTCSDVAAGAEWVVNQSIKINQLGNMHCATMDWNQLPATQPDDVLLLSDVNYDTAIFSELFELLKKCLHNKTTILLSTPQRLMAKPFIENILPYCIQQQEITTVLNNHSTFTTVLVLQDTRTNYGSCTNTGS